MAGPYSARTDFEPTVTLARLRARNQGPPSRSIRRHSSVLAAPKLSCTIRPYRIGNRANDRGAPTMTVAGSGYSLEVSSHGDRCSIGSTVGQQ